MRKMGWFIAKYTPLYLYKYLTILIKYSGKGCGLAGYTPEQIAPLFKDAIDVENIYLPKSFWDVLHK